METGLAGVRGGRVLLVAGPTASGKSALALGLARRLGATVVNADSMQVYRDLRVLSARPAPDDIATAPHALYGFVDGAREYSVGDWLRDVAPLLKDEERPLVIVGGTGLYFHALTTGLVETPPAPPAIRDGLQARAAAGENLHAALRAVDPVSAARIAPADMPRILRALEMWQVTGRPFSEWRARTGPPLLRAGAWKGIQLAPARETLVARIDARFKDMLTRGALDEVARLVARGLPGNRGVMKAHGVPHLAAHLAGEIGLADAISRGQADTRRYAKRQLTWARRFMSGWTWVGEDLPDADAILRSASSQLRPDAYILHAAFGRLW